MKENGPSATGLSNNNSFKIIMYSTMKPTTLTKQTQHLRIRSNQWSSPNDHPKNDQGPAVCAKRLNPPPPTCREPGVLNVSPGTAWIRFRPAPRIPPGCRTLCLESIKNRIPDRLQSFIRFLIDFDASWPPFWAPFSSILAPFCLPKRYQNRLRFSMRLQIVF